MPTHPYKTIDFYIKESKDKDRHLLFTTIFQETNDKLGYFLIGFTSELKENISSKISSLLYNCANFYFTHESGLLPPEKNFEETIKFFNKSFQEQISEHYHYSKKINITLALLINSNLHFANYGNNLLLLITPKKTIDLIKKLAADLTVSGDKLLAQIFSGDIAKYHRLALTNRELASCLPREELDKIFSLPPLANIENQITLKLEQLNKKNKTTFAGTIIETKPSTLPTLKLTPKTPPDQSINKLIATANKTKKLLQPKIFPDTTKLKSLLNKLKPKSQKKRRLPYSTSPTKFIKLNLETIKNIPFYIKKVKRVKYLLKQTITNLKTLLTNLRYHWRRLIHKFKQLPKISKILLIISTILVVALTTSITSLHIKKRESMTINYYQQITAQIKELHDKVEAAIIYGDNKSARYYLNQSLNLIHSLPTNSKEREQTKQNLLNKYRELSRRINKVVKVNSPLLFLDLNNFNQQMKLNYLTSAKSHLITLGKKHFLDINVGSKEISEQITTDIANNQPLLMADTDGQIIILTQNGSLYKYDIPTASTLKLETNLDTKETNIIDLASYNRRLYLLDANNKQIWRLLPQGNNFGPPRPWLKEEINKQVNWRSFAIDGSIYILADGQVKQYIQGKKTDFTIEEIEPNLVNATIIKTNTNIPYLYILDPNNKRLVIFDKKGKLVKQYISPIFDNLKDFTVIYKAEKNKSHVYLLNGNKIYLIAIEE